MREPFLRAFRRACRRSPRSLPPRSPGACTMSRLLRSARAMTVYVPLLGCTQGSRVGANRQRIVELFPTAHRKASVASARQRIAEILAEAIPAHDALALVRRRSSAGCVRKSVPGATREASQFARETRVALHDHWPGGPHPAAAPDEQGDLEPPRADVETVGSGRHSPCTCGGGRTTLQALRCAVGSQVVLRFPVDSPPRPGLTACCWRTTILPATAPPSRGRHPPPPQTGPHRFGRLATRGGEERKASPCAASSSVNVRRFFERKPWCRRTSWSIYIFSDRHGWWGVSIPRR